MNGKQNPIISVQDLKLMILDNHKKIQQLRSLYFGEKQVEHRSDFGSQQGARNLRPAEKQVEEEQR